jgi:hypothetical protein
VTVFRVLASRTELFLIEAHIRAADVRDAETKFYEALEGEVPALSWIQDFDSSDTEIDSIEQVTSDHEAVPSEDQVRCLYCGRLIQWTGTPVLSHQPGQPIPGPWIHIQRPLASEGLGL